MVVLYQLSYRGRTYTAAGQPWSDQAQQRTSTAAERRRGGTTQPGTIPPRAAPRRLGEASYSATHRCVNGTPDGRTTRSKKQTAEPP